MSVIWFRRWYWLARLLGLPAKRAVTFVCDLDAATVPLRNLAYWIRHPLLWWEVRRGVRLALAGRAEVQA